MFGFFIGFELRDESVMVSILKNGLPGIRLLSSASFPFNDDEATLALIRAHIGRHVPGAAKVFVTIPDKWAFIKFTEVPSTKGRGRDAFVNLMKFEIERHIPYDMEKVLYDFQIIRETASTYTVAFITIQKSRAERVTEYLDKLSLQPHGITVSSFALLNAVEMSGASVGGWRNIIGIMPGESVLSAKNETNVSLYLDKSGVSAAVLSNGSLERIRFFPHIEHEDEEVICNEIYDYLSGIKTEINIEGYKKQVVSGDISALPGFAASLSAKTGMEPLTIQGFPKFSGASSEDIKGASPSAGACLGGLGIGRYKINLLPHKADYEAKRPPSLMTKVLFAILVALIAGLGFMTSLKNKKAIDRIDEELSRNAPMILEYRQLSQEAESYKQQGAFLESIAGNEMTLEVLAELSNLLPGDTWIANMSYKIVADKESGRVSGELILNGYSDSSSSLISLLEGSPFFENVEFVGSVKKTKDKEGFRIKASVIRPVKAD
ncbi:MAG: PilN domain-containing protein [Nitrospirae bacterium]|nr:PilN domain-containing protein [Nitrospirota bacterium]